MIKSPTKTKQKKKKKIKKKKPPKNQSADLPIPLKAQSLANLSAVLEASGSSIDNVVKVNIFLTDIADFATINTVYDKVFHKEPKPCRTCVAVHQLPLGTDVEIECTAHL
jgi:reactive intermediate/imine deaminase